MTVKYIVDISTYFGSLDNLENITFFEGQRWETNCRCTWLLYMKNHFNSIIHIVINGKTSSFL